MSPLTQHFQAMLQHGPLYVFPNGLVFKYFVQPQIFKSRILPDRVLIHGTDSDVTYAPLPLSWKLLE